MHQTFGRVCICVWIAESDSWTLRLDRRSWEKGLSQVMESVVQAWLASASTLQLAETVWSIIQSLNRLNERTFWTIVSLAQSGTTDRGLRLRRFWHYIPFHLKICRAIICISPHWSFPCDVLLHFVVHCQDLFNLRSVVHHYRIYRLE